MVASGSKPHVALSNISRDFLASGSLVNVTAGKQISLTYGALRGLSRINARVESEPGLNIEIRLAGSSRSNESFAPQRAFQLESNQILVVGSARSNTWVVDLPEQANFDTVSFVFHRGAVETLAGIDPNLASYLLACIETPHFSVKSLTPFQEQLAVRVLSVKPARSGSSAFVYSLALQVLLSIYWAEAPISSQLIDGTVDDHDLVELASSYIELHPSCTVTSTQVAAYCLVSVSRLNLAFRRASRFTVSALIRQKVMTQAKSFLAQGLRVNEVANLMGYSTPEAFSKTFTAHFGLSPRQFKSNSLNRN